MYVRWGGTTATVSGGVALTPGIDADAFAVALAPPESVISTSADLVLGDGAGGEITLRDCAAVEGSIEYDPSTYTARFTAWDYRWRWRFSDTIEGEYNYRDEAGEYVGEKLSARDLAELLTDLLPLPAGAWALTGLPADDHPYIQWEHADPALALHDLCERYGADICPQLDGGCSVLKRGEGADLPARDRVAYSIRQTVNRAPGRVRVVGGRNRYQVAVELVAVAEESSARKMVPVADATWKPAGGYFLGWGTAWTQTTMQAIMPAVITLWQTYAFDPATTVSAAVVAGGAPPKAVEWGAAEASRYWLSSLVETEIVAGDEDDQERRRAPYITADAYMTADAVCSRQGRLEGDDLLLDVPFTIDYRRGVVRFSDPVYDVDGGGLIKGANLVMHCAFEGDIYTRDFTNPAGNADLIGTVRAPDLYVEYIDGAAQNQGDTDDAADRLAEDYLRAIGSFVETGRVEVYPGIVPLELSGKIRQVSWSVDAASVTTTASYIHQGETLTTPPPEVRARDVDLSAAARARHTVRGPTYSHPED